jgi:LDH2 family malate/lactate/ureidoglycolate dehydrogenase
MASKVTVDPGKLTRFSVKVLQKVGVPEADAERTARMLVAADLQAVVRCGVGYDNVDVDAATDNHVLVVNRTLL